MTTRRGLERVEDLTAKASALAQARVYYFPFVDEFLRLLKRPERHWETGPESPEKNLMAALRAKSRPTRKTTTKVYKVFEITS